MTAATSVSVLLLLGCVASGCSADKAGGHPVVGDPDGGGGAPVGPDGGSADAGDNLPPTARIEATPLQGTAPLRVDLDATGSTDPDGRIVAYHWDFGDGATLEGAELAHIYADAGSFSVALTVTDDDGATARGSVELVVEAPTDGSLGTQLLRLEVGPEEARVRVLLRMSDAEGGALPGLTADAFAVEEDGRAVSTVQSYQRLGSLEGSYASYSALVFDLSGAAYYLPDVIEALQDAARAYAGALLGPEGPGSERVAVYGFGSTVEQVLDFSADLDAVLDGIERLGRLRSDDHTTNVNGALIEANRHLVQARQRADASATAGTLVLFSDGTDRANVYSGADAQATVAVEAARGPFGNRIFTVGSGGQVDREALAALGKDGSLFSESFGELGVPFGQIADEVLSRSRSVYLLEYISQQRAGTHALRVGATVDGERGSLTCSFDGAGFVPPRLWLRDGAQGSPRSIGVGSELELVWYGTGFLEAYPHTIHWGSTAAALDDTIEGPVEPGRRGDGGEWEHRAVFVPPGDGGSFFVQVRAEPPRGSPFVSDVAQWELRPGVPTITAIEDVVLALNEERTVVFSVGNPSGTLDGLAVECASSDETLLPAAEQQLEHQGDGLYHLQVRPRQDEVGTATLTVTVRSERGESVAGGLDVTVLPPAVSVQPPQDVSLPMDGSTVVMLWAQDPRHDLRVSASSSDQELLPDEGLDVSETSPMSGQYLLTIGPAEHRFGVAEVTVEVANRYGEVGSASFSVRVANDVPTIEAIADQTCPKDGTIEVEVVVADVGTPLGDLQVTATSADPSIFPDAGLVVTGDASPRLLSISPAAAAFGEANVTVTVGDGFDSASTSFLVHVPRFVLRQVLAPDGEEPASLGSAMAADGDRLLVGGGINEPAAWFFHRSEAGWVQAAKVVPSDDALGRHFGWAVAIDGDTAAVTASSSALVWMYRWDGQTWGEAGVVAPIERGNRFGASVAVDGDRMVVGESYWYPQGSDVSNQIGRAQTFHRDGQGQWSGVHLQPGAAGRRYFGAELALLGDRLLVSDQGRGDVMTNRSQTAEAHLFAWDDDANRWQPVETPTLRGSQVALGESHIVTGCDNGTASVYRRDAQGAWAPGATSRFGDGNNRRRPVALAGDLVAVGVFEQRLVQTFVLQGDAWVEQDELVPPDLDERNDSLTAVAVGGTAVFVAVENRQGASRVYVFDE